MCPNCALARRQSGPRLGQVADAPGRVLRPGEHALGVELLPQITILSRSNGKWIYLMKQSNLSYPSLGGRMDQTERDHLQHELEIAANELLPGWIRRVELLQHDDAPWMEPGQLMPRLVFKDPAERVRDPHPDPRKVAKAARTFKL